MKLYPEERRAIARMIVTVGVAAIIVAFLLVTWWNYEVMAPTGPAWKDPEPRAGYMVFCSYVFGVPGQQFGIYQAPDDGGRCPTKPRYVQAAEGMSMAALDCVAFDIVRRDFQHFAASGDICDVYLWNGR